jgi:carbamate kinase
VITVVALGGNALLRRDEPPEATIQESHVREAAALLSEVIASADEGARFVITHGNGPQVGLLALQSLQDERLAPYPLDVLDAESEGMIGYLLERELRNHLPGREVATLLTQVEVEESDPAFQAPSKPIGRVYTADEAARLREQYGWRLAPDGDGLRRVVASPRPRRILGLANVRSLLDAEAVVICAGGGGIPVVYTVQGDDDVPTLRGIEAVIDKDLVSARLAVALEADRLWLLTDVDAVYECFAQPDARAYKCLETRQLETLDFAPGSMGPKVEAAGAFALETGKEAVIGRLEEVALLAAGSVGTRVVRSNDSPRGRSEPSAG